MAGDETWAEGSTTRAETACGWSALGMMRKSGQRGVGDCEQVGLGRLRGGRETKPEKVGTGASLPHA